ncbi:MAG: TraB/GumN family protein [Xanthomonadales bacterium]|nr:TraB/GumN family protein [Xanthomonadales bacterium]
MTTEAAPAGPTDPAAQIDKQPLERISRDGVEYIVLGTAHVSRASAEAARQLASELDIDAIAVELDAGRHQALTDAESWRKLDLFEVIRKGKAGLVAANLALGAYQRRLAEQFGIEPGAELKIACEVAAKRDKPLWLIDRDIGLTLRRAYAAISLWDRFKLINGMLASLFVDEQIDESEIEKLKEGDLLERTFSEFASQSEGLYHSLIAERDDYMAARLRDEAGKAAVQRVLVIIGAGHMKGMGEALAHGEQAPTEVRERLEQPPPPSLFGRIFNWTMITAVVALLIWGFVQGLSTGTEVLTVYVAMTGGLAFTGALLAGAHPLSALAGGLSAPLTVLHPALAAGMFSAGAEAWLRRPTVADFEALKNDVATPKGWWRNRVARVLLVFVLTNLTTAIGVWVAGVEIIRRLN